MKNAGAKFWNCCTTMAAFWSDYIWPLVVMVAESVMLLVILLIAVAYVLLADRKIEIDLDNRAREWLAQAGYDPVYGARPLKRVIQRNLQDPLAELILAGDVRDGDHVAIAAEGNVLTFNGKAPQTAEIAQFETPKPKRKLH